MLVQAKKAVQEGHPSGYIFDRMVKEGEIFEITDEPVVHYALDKDGKEIMEDAIDANGLPIKDEKGKVLQRPVRVIAFTAGSHSPNGVVKEYTELEKRKAILAKNVIRGITKEERELYLKFQNYSPVWMKPAPKKAFPTIIKETSSPESDINKMGPADAIAMINKTFADPVLKKWLEIEEENQKRPEVLGVLKAQMKNANGR